jgi:hypothetical protein
MSNSRELPGLQIKVILVGEEGTGKTSMMNINPYIYGHTFNPPFENSFRKLVPFPPSFPTGLHYLAPPFTKTLARNNSFVYLEVKVISGWQWEGLRPGYLRGAGADVVGLCLPVDHKDGFTNIYNKARYQNTLNGVSLIWFS